jgi:hypothetical protein
MRDSAHADARRCRRLGSADVHQVLDRKRDTVERSSIVSRGELAVGLARLLPRFFRHYQDEGIRRLIALRDPSETAFDHFFRRDRSGAQLRAELLNRHPVSV